MRNNGINESLVCNFRSKCFKKFESADDVLNLICIASQYDSNYFDLSFLLKSLVTKLRCFLVSQSQSWPWIDEWDKSMAFLLINVIFPSTISDSTVKRFCVNLVVDDLRNQGDNESVLSIVIDACTTLTKATIAIENGKIAEILKHLDGLASHSILSSVFVSVKPRADNLLHTYILCTPHPSIDVIRAFTDNGLNIDIYSKSYESILHTIVRLFHLELIPFVVNNCLNLIVEKDRFGMTPLQILLHTMSVSAIKAKTCIDIAIKSVIELIGPHYDLIWDDTYTLDGSQHHDPTVCPFYLGTLFGHESLSKQMIILAAEVYNDRYQPLLLRTIDSIIQKQRIELLKTIIKYFDVSSLYHHMTVTSILSKSVNCFELLLSLSIMDSEKYSLLPRPSSPLLHLAIAVDMSCIDNSQTYLLPNNSKLYDNSFACKLLLAYSVEVVKDVLFHVNDIRFGEQEAKEDQSIEWLAELSHSISPISFACLLGNRVFIHFAQRYCNKFGILLSEVRQSNDSIMNEQKRILSGVNPFVCCVIGNSKDCWMKMSEWSQSEQVNEMSQGLGSCDVLDVLLTLLRQEICSPFREYTPLNLSSPLNAAYDYSMTNTSDAMFFMDQILSNDRLHVVPQQFKDETSDKTQTNIILTKLYSILMKIKEYYDRFINRITAETTDPAAITSIQGIKILLERLLVSSRRFTSILFHIEPYSIFRECFIDDHFNSDSTIILEDNLLESTTWSSVDNINNSLKDWKDLSQKEACYKRLWYNHNVLLRDQSFKVTLRILMRKFTPDPVWMKIIKALLILIYPNEYWSVAKSSSNSYDWWKELLRRSGYSISRKALTSQQTDNKIHKFVNDILDCQNIGTDYLPCVNDQKVSIEDYEHLIRQCFLTDPLRVNIENIQYPALPRSQRNVERVRTGLFRLYDVVILIVHYRSFHIKASKTNLKFEISENTSLCVRTKHDASTRRSIGEAAIDHQNSIRECSAGDLLTVKMLWSQYSGLIKSLQILTAQSSFNSKLVTCDQSIGQMTLWSKLRTFLGINHDVSVENEELINLLKSIKRFSVECANRDILPDTHHLIIATHSGHQLNSYNHKTRLSNRSSKTCLSRVEETICRILQLHEKYLILDSELLKRMIHLNLWDSAVLYLDLIGKSRVGELSYDSFQLSRFLSDKQIKTFQISLNWISDEKPSVSSLRRLQQLQKQSRNVGSDDINPDRLSSISVIHYAIYMNRYDFLNAYVRALYPVHIDCDLFRFAYSSHCMKAILKLSWLKGVSIDLFSLNQKYTLQLHFPLAFDRDHGRIHHMNQYDSFDKELCQYIDNCSCPVDYNVIGYRMVESIQQYLIQNIARFEEKSLVSVPSWKGLMFNEDCTKLRMMDQCTPLVSMKSICNNVTKLLGVLPAPTQLGTGCNIFKFLIGKNQKNRNDWRFIYDALSNIEPPCNLDQICFMNGLEIFSDETSLISLAAQNMQHNIVARFLQVILKLIGFTPTARMNLREVISICNKDLAEHNYYVHSDLIENVRILHIEKLFIVPLKKELDLLYHRVVGVENEISKEYMTKARRFQSWNQNSVPRYLELNRSISSIDSEIGLLQYGKAMMHQAWSFLTSSACEMDSFLSLSNKLSFEGINGSSMDSLIRARKLLILLGIPYSRLGSMDKDKPENSSRESKNQVVYGLMTPTELLHSMPMNTVNQIRVLLQGWIRQRLNANALRRNIQLSKIVKTLQRSNSIMFLDDFIMMKDIHHSLVNFAELKQSNNRCTKTLALDDETVWNIYDLLEIETQQKYHVNRFKATSTDNHGYISGISRANISLNEEIIRKSLRIAYLIIEYSRLILFTRAMTIVTSEYNLVRIDKSNTNNQSDTHIMVSKSPRSSKKISISDGLVLKSSETLVSTLRPHSWDCLQQEYQSVKRRYETIQSQYATIVQSRRNDQSSSIFLGSRSQLPLTNELTAADLSNFTSFTSQTSHRLKVIREYILSCFIEICRNTNQIPLSDYLCRCYEGQSMNENQLKSDSLNPINQLINHLQHLTIKDLYFSVYNPIDNSYNPKKWEMFNELLKTIQNDLNNIHVSDDHDMNCDLLEPMPEEYHHIDEMLSKILIQTNLNNNNKQLTVLNDSQLQGMKLNDLIESCLNDMKILSSSVSVNQLQSTLRVLSNIKKQQLQQVYHTANSLYSYLRNVAGVLERLSLYHHDLDVMIEKYYKRSNILMDLLLPILRQRRQGNYKNESKELIENCGKTMLMIGFSSLSRDRYDRCALVAAVLLGFNDLLNQMMIIEKIERTNYTLNRLSSTDEKSTAINNHIMKSRSFKHLIWHSLFHYSYNDETGVGHRQSIKVLLDYGFPVFKPDGSTLNSLDLAAIKDTIELVDDILENMIAMDCDSTSISVEEWSNSLLLLISNKRVDKETIIRLINHLRSKLSLNDTISHHLYLYQPRLKSHISNLITKDFNHHSKYVCHYYLDNGNDNDTHNEEVQQVSDQTIFMECIQRLQKQLPKPLFGDITELPLYHTLNHIMSSINNDNVSLKSNDKAISIIETVIQMNRIDLFEFIADEFIFHISNYIIPVEYSSLMDKLNMSVWMPWICYYNLNDLINRFLSFDIKYNQIDQYHQEYLKEMNHYTCGLLSTRFQVPLDNSSSKKTLLDIAMSVRQSQISDILLQRIESVQSIASMSIDDTWSRLNVSDITDLTIHDIIDMIVNGSISKQCAVRILRIFFSQGGSDISSLLHSPLPRSVCGDTLLHIVCCRGDVEIMNYLLTIECDPLQTNSQGLTALNYSVSAGQREITRILFHHHCYRQILRSFHHFANHVRKYLLERHFDRN